MSSMNMSIAKPIIASGLVVPVGVNNLDLYIPKVDEKYSEEEIKFMFADMAIGMVDYVDFVATKDPETKKLKFYSAFLRLREWNPDGYWYNNIIVEKLNKIQISRTEFWIILPAKTPLSRSKVNTHQLAAYTDELYVRVEAIEKSVTENITVSSTHFQNLLAKSEAQAAQIEQLMKIVEAQSRQLERIDKYLMDKHEPETTRARALTIEDLNQYQDPDQIKCETCSMEFDTEKQLHFHSEVCKKKEQTTVEEVRAEQKSPVVFCDDECFFFKPLNFVDTTTPKQKKAGIESGTFSFDLEDVLGPVAKSMGLTKDEVRNGLEKEWADSQRVRAGQKSPVVFCDDECFFLKPLQNHTETTTTKRSPTKPKLDIISGTVSMDIEDLLGPVAKSMGLTKEEVRKGLNDEFAKTKRAKSSKKFCGNA